MRSFVSAAALLFAVEALADPGFTPNANNGLKITKRSEFCGTDSNGIDWYCDDPSTTCCFGTLVWQCAPITAAECCTTGLYCPDGSSCYLSNTGEQLCLEVEGGSSSGGSSGPATTHTITAASGATAHSTTHTPGATVTGKRGGSTGLPPPPFGPKNAAGSIGANVLIAVIPAVGVLAGMLAL